MNITEKITTGHKIMIGCIIALFCIGGIWLLINKYMQAVADVSQVVNKNPIGQKAVDLAKVEGDYLSKSTKILDDYFLAVDSGQADIIGLSKKAQTDLLNLTLTAQYKEKHLAEVLLLGGIVELAQAGNQTAISKKLKDLKDLSQKQ